MKKISRRDFLKIGGGVLGSSIAASLLPQSSKIKNDRNQPNIVVLVCDAMTAKNLSLYGYPRKTTPYMEELANQALVYHNHHANGSFTVPGTASILTGLLPWTHRAVNPSGVIRSELVEHNIFKFLGNYYYKQGFSQNDWATNLLYQFSSDIDTLLPPSEFGILNNKLPPSFTNDELIANHANEQMYYYNNSLFLSFITSIYNQLKINKIPAETYPFGFPYAHYYDRVFTMQDLFDGITENIFDLTQSSQPFFSYVHIFPPHRPYHPHENFAGMFDNDNYQPIIKKEQVLSKGANQQSLDHERKRYDSFLANIDFEIGRLIQSLREHGIIENTYFILTADHGEMFERGTDGHFTAMLYEPVIKIPLMIFGPNINSRQDIFSPTSSIDLMPTILNLTGNNIPSSCEGDLLPSLGGIDDPNRTVISVEAKESFARNPFPKATYSIIKGNHKLIYYTGYVHKYKDYYEFYDLQEDPEELSDKYSKPKFASVVAEMKNELLSAVNETNKKL